MKINNQINLTFQHRIILNILFSFGVIAAVVFLLILPLAKKIKVDRLAVYGQRYLVEERYEQSKMLKQMKGQYRLIESDLTKLESVFINEGRELEFITTMEAIAAENGITQKITLGAVNLEPKSRLAKSSISVAAGGSFPRLINYLSNLETLPYYININQISLSAGTTGRESVVGETEISDQGKKINLTFSADVFWLTIQ